MKTKTNKFRFLISVVNGRETVKLMKPTQRKLTAATEILASLYEHVQDDEMKQALEGIRMVCLRYCVHDVQKDLPIMAEEPEECPDVT